MNIDKWVTPDPVTVDAAKGVSVAIKKMNERRIGAILVTENEQLVGVFSERDLLRICAEEEEAIFSRPIGDFMTKNPICAQITDDYNSVYMQMKTNRIRHIPILDGEKLIGIVSIRDLAHFYQNKLESEFSEARDKITELEHLSSLSDDDRLQTLVEEIRKYKELSLTDHLTGLYNKRYFMSRLREETARAKRYKQDLSLIFCDVDHFKRINDNHGHHAGDLVLKQIAGVLSGGMDDMNIISRLRKADIVARYGGEEFVAILPETSVDGAIIAAENVRKAIEGFLFRLNGKKSHITMSFGVAGVTEETIDEFDLIQKADDALYLAKELGRNRCEIYKKKAK